MPAQFLARTVAVLANARTEPLHFGDERRAIQAVEVVIHVRSMGLGAFARQAQPIPS